jgi:phosphopantothenoylcysteine decarboxylase/phosphopantothenate--cysteine ligase
VAVCAAAVGDWRPARSATRKIKKNGGPPALQLSENPDILATLAKPGNRRPRIVIGFAAETENVVANATAKRARKGCDWMLANDVGPDSGTFGGESNVIHFITAAGAESWPRLDKREVAARLAERIAAALRPEGAIDTV